MSNDFREKTAEEMLTLLPEDRCCKTAFISALAKQSGSIKFVRKRMNLSVSLSSYQECLAVVDILHSLYPAEIEISLEHVRSGAKKGMVSYGVSIPAGFTPQVLDDCRLTTRTDGFFGFEEGVPEEFSGKRCCAISYLKGLFLACGYVFVPAMSGEEKRDGYHFEYRLEDEAYAASVSDMLNAMGIPAKTSERSPIFLVYLKDKEEILRLLALLGLCESVLTLRSIIDERETANSINRVTICEAANLDKTYAAAARQLLAIGTIEERDGLDSLSAALRETACARMEYPQASMQELSDILGITKSCLNHRLRKLAVIAGAESEKDCPESGE